MHLPIGGHHVHTGTKLSTPRRIYQVSSTWKGSLELYYQKILLGGTETGQEYKSTHHAGWVLNLDGAISIVDCIRSSNTVLYDGREIAIYTHKHSRNPIDKVDRQQQNSIVSIWPNSEFGRFLFSPGSPSSIND